ncbi:MAG: multiple sugar transport system substrate-binding protein [Mycobacteriales bacterium]
MRRSNATTLAAALAAVALGATACLGAKDNNADPNRGAGAKDVTLTISANAIAGGKNATEADWVTKYVIPTFTDKLKQDGINATIKFQPSGVDDEQYKAKLALDLRAGGGADIVSLDGIWVGEFAEAGYLKPLDAVVGGDAVSTWDGWAQIPQTVQQNMSFEDKRYGIPSGTDGRVLFYNKTLLTRAGLPATWQPTSWADVISAGQKLKAAGVPTPIQLNAGTAMGEATTMQGTLPLLVGTGKEIYDPVSKKWQGATTNVKQVLTLYQQIYGGGLGDKTLQQEAKGRDKSFADFAAGKIGILLESDYFWRSVIEPKAGIAAMKDRDQVVGYAKIPAIQPGAGVRGQDFVSMSGGGGRAINPNTKFPQQAWQLLAFMNSAEATKALLQGSARLTQRTDVNDQVLTADPMLDFIAKQVLPLTAYRPGLAVYPQVSTALQQATADVIAGKSPDAAAATYQSTVEKAVGGSGNVATS